MTTYYAAGPTGAGLIEHLLNEITWLRATVDLLTERLGVESQPASDPATAELSTNPDKLDGYATGYVDGLAAQETAVNATVIPFPRRGPDEDITEIVSRLNRRLTGQPESS